MVMSRSFLTVAFAAILALAAIALLNGSPLGTTPSALAGPCGPDPKVYYGDSDSPGIPNLFANPGSQYIAPLEVVTNPEVLPPGKPPVTIEEEFPDPDIDITFTPSQAGGSFFTTMRVDVPLFTVSAVYEITVTVTCHTQFSDYPFLIYVDQCPAPIDRQFSVSGVEGSPFPDTCEAPTETPIPTCPAALGVQGACSTPTPTPSVVPSLTPTPTLPPSETPLSEEAIWGDVDCSDEVNPIDSLKELRIDAGLPATQVPFCPAWNAFVRFLLSLNNEIGVQGGLEVPWGDVDCSGALNPVDSLKLLREDAGLNLDQPNGCPPLGDQVAFELVQAQ